MIPLLMDALTRPLTEDEQQKGQWTIPDKRILFEGTFEEALDFYQQTEIIRRCKMPLMLFIQTVFR
jgi:hypothetical protein